MLSTIGSAELFQALSSPRFHLFQGFFKTSDDNATFGTYQWHEAVRASLLPLVGYVEVAVRNTIHHTISQQVHKISSSRWYDANEPKSIHLSGAPRRHADDLINKTDSNGNLVITSPDEFVANATFGFWVDVLRQIEKGRRYKFASSMFPGYVATTLPPNWNLPGPWQTLVESIHQHKLFRDWVCHFNPLWKWKFYPNATSAPISPTSPGAAMTSIRQQVARMVTTLEQINPAFAKLWHETYSHRHFSQLTTTKALFHFQRQSADVSPSRVTPDPRYSLNMNLWSAEDVSLVANFVRRD